MVFIPRMKINGRKAAEEKIIRSKFQYLENKQCKSLIAANNISIEAPASVASLPYNPQSPDFVPDGIGTGGAGKLINDTIIRYFYKKLIFF